MKASELRIGNLIKYCNDLDGSPIHLVKTLDKNSVNETSLELYSLIPLTEEWIKRLGFEKEGDHFNKKITQDRFFIIKEEDDESLKGVYFLCDTDVGASLKFVHQLQNLYFAMTGTELEIK